MQVSNNIPSQVVLIPWNQDTAALYPRASSIPSNLEVTGPTTSLALHPSIQRSMTFLVFPQAMMDFI